MQLHPNHVFKRTAWGMLQSFRPLLASGRLTRRYTSVKIAMLCSLIALAVVPIESRACGWLPPAEQAQRDAADLQKQRLLVREIAVEADSIVVARATHVAVVPSGDANLQEGTVIAKFTVRETLKGAEHPGVKLTSYSSLSVGCYPSVSFRNIRLDPGTSYVVYAKRGDILRAAPLKRTRGYISFRQERKIIRSMAGV